MWGLKQQRLTLHYVGTETAALGTTLCGTETAALDTTLCGD